MGESNSNLLLLIKLIPNLPPQAPNWEPGILRQGIMIAKAFTPSHPLKEKQQKDAETKEAGKWGERARGRKTLFFQHWPILFRSNNSKAAESLQGDCKTITLLNYFLLARQANLLFDNASCSKTVNFIIQRSWEKDHRYSLLTPTR